MQKITDYLTKETPCNNNTSEYVATRTYFKILSKYQAHTPLFILKTLLIL